MNRLGEALGIVMFDLDRFKVINDERGHLAGDAVLRDVVAAVREVIRAEDEIYRFGGEEFLVVVHVADAAALDAACERIRRSVSELVIAHPRNVPHGVVTISVGAALVRADEIASTDDAWFAVADAALYRAKGGWRNRVEVAA